MAVTNQFFFYARHLPPLPRLVPALSLLSHQPKAFVWERTCKIIMNPQNHLKSLPTLPCLLLFCFSLPVCVCCWFSLSAVHFIKSHKNTTHVWHFSEPAISDSKQPCEWKRLDNVASLLMSSSLNETNTVRPHNNQVQSQAFTKPQHKKGDIR